MYKIPVYQPSLLGNEKKYVNECIDTGWISGKGKFISEFESKFANFISVRQAIAVCNGTVALHLALVALGIGEGDEVIVPTFTYIAPVNAVTYTGATPVFVDSLRDTWQINPAQIRQKITSRTRAIIAVHLYGHPCDLDTICDLAKEYGLFVIEDCAEAFGSLYKSERVGSFGDIATFSFYGNKTITTGEGGMVVTSDETLYDRSLHFKGQGLAKYREYWHDVVGFNYRMSNICAAIGLAQLERAEEIIQKKLQIARWYDELLADSPFATQSCIGDVQHSYWMYSILVPETRQRDAVRGYLKSVGIETRPTFYPVHTMPMYSQRYERHPIAEDIGWRGINIPSYPDLTQEQIEFICHSLKEALKIYAKESNSLS
ncbi:MAG: DegT/DnrJ/EryC1/StrS aminotransferase family protein [Hydrococcus sp. RM1_1_31]|nr:DegT/DnrJ/EryC1/StrS aminotransferase family protein [Hydrococcus sp. RM1_1_31]